MSERLEATDENSQYAPIITTFKLDTKHLPDSVVNKDVAFSISMLDIGEKRLGYGQMGYRYGDEENCPITQEEYEYLAAVLEYAKEILKRKINNAPEQKGRGDSTCQNDSDM